MWPLHPCFCVLHGSRLIINVSSPLSCPHSGPLQWPVCAPVWHTPSLLLSAGKLASLCYLLLQNTLRFFVVPPVPLTVIQGWYNNNNYYFINPFGHIVVWTAAHALDDGTTTACDRAWSLQGHSKQHLQQFFASLKLKKRQRDWKHISRLMTSRPSPRLLGSPVPNINVTVIMQFMIIGSLGVETLNTFKHLPVYKFFYYLSFSISFFCIATSFTSNSDFSVIYTQVVDF